MHSEILILTRLRSYFESDTGCKFILTLIKIRSYLEEENYSITLVEYLIPVIEIPAGVFAAIFLAVVCNTWFTAAKKACPASLDTSTCHFFTFSSAIVKYVKESKCCYCCYARHCKSRGQRVHFQKYQNKASDLRCIDTSTFCSVRLLAYSEYAD